MFVFSLLICGFFCLVESQNQYQEFQSYPYGQRYTNIYGSQPVIVEPLTYDQVYNNIPNHFQYPETYPLANQLQEIYLKKILSNPTIQAFIDPGTRIYNQNGVEISDQIRPITPKVVNNYFIVPTDYIKTNDSRVNSKKLRNTNRNDYYDLHPKRCVKSKDTEEQCKNKQRVKERKNNQDHNDRQINNKSILQETGIAVDELCDTNNKKKCNYKRQDKYSLKNEDSKKNNVDTSEGSEKTLGTQNQSKKYTKNHRLSKDETKQNYREKIKSECDIKCDELFDINNKCCDLDDRNIRNFASYTHNKRSHKDSSKAQNDFMYNWMNYVKMFMPDQNFDSLDFSNINFPYNFEQMYQMPNFYNTRSLNRSDKKEKEQKQKIQAAKSESYISDAINETSTEKNIVVELSPKFVEIESPVTENVKTDKVTSLTPETKSEKSLKDRPQDNEHKSDIVLEQIIEDLPVENQLKYNDIIDYYPDFTNDPKYTTDEDDLFFFHNRHYYNTDDALTRETRKFDRDSDSFKQTENLRDNDIPSYKKSNLKENDEYNKFRNPPGLKEPGFQTKKIDKKNKADLYSFYIDDTDRSDFRQLEKDANNVETAFARSKVVKYGKPKETSKLKSNSNQKVGKEKENNLHGKDRDTTIVYSRPWDS